jgi:hypothetical protein
MSGMFIFNGLGSLFVLHVLILTIIGKQEKTSKSDHFESMLN